jgi:hypothetical protein
VIACGVVDPQRELTSLLGQPSDRGSALGLGDFPRRCDRVRCGCARRSSGDHDDLQIPGLERAAHRAQQRVARVDQGHHLALARLRRCESCVPTDSEPSRAERQPVHAPPRRRGQPLRPLTLTHQHGLQLRA